MASVSLDSVSKVYPGGVEAVKSVSLEVADGAFVVLVGPSGCGKSTLLRMIAGLETVSAGTVRIGERTVNDIEPADRDIAMVFQNYALYPHMSVFDNMAYGLRNRGTPADEVQRRVTQTARLLEIEAMLERLPRQLSGGQRQRVAMGRAIVRQPQAFLFDEPLSNLDAKLRVQMRVEIKKLQREIGTTSIYVTHDQVEAMTMADRLVVMNRGVAEQIGSPRDVYRAPASTFVASFIGSPAMNFLNARVGDTADAIAIGEARIPLAEAVPLAPGRNLTLGIRPEHIFVEPDARHMTVIVDLIEHLGMDTIVYGRTSDKQTLTIRINGDREFAPGEALGVRLDTVALHLFDADTGQRL
ncbi:MAG: sn-glycerol-3-phosphate import ATP-binding protein UgpC [Hyphomicrobiaceae bacterium]